MGVKIAIAFHKDMPFPELIEKIVAAYKDAEVPAEGFKVPYPFWAAILDTRSMTVIHYAVEELLKAYEKADDLHLELQAEETAALKKILNTRKLDEVYLVCHEKLGQGGSEQAQALRDFLAIGGSQMYKDIVASRPAARQLVSANPEPQAPSGVFQKHVFGGARHPYSFRAVVNTLLTDKPVVGEDGVRLTPQQEFDKWKADGCPPIRKDGRVMPIRCFGESEVSDGTPLLDEYEASLYVALDKAIEDTGDADSERRPMTQADLSRIHMTDYVDDGWKREVGPNGPTGFMIRAKGEENKQ